MQIEKKKCDKEKLYAVKKCGIWLVTHRHMVMTLRGATILLIVGSESGYHLEYGGFVPSHVTISRKRIKGHAPLLVWYFPYDLVYPEKTLRR
jgi:hypothetical protein